MQGKFYSEITEVNGKKPADIVGFIYDPDADKIQAYKNAVAIELSLSSGIFTGMFSPPLTEDDLQLLVAHLRAACDNLRG